MSDEKRPIIIKRKKVIAGGHHGGAWKVAYADFVTAMMAFFMLMWLLNAASEQQRAGLADYFAPTTSINRTSGGGDGLFGGDSIFTDDTLVKNGQGASFLHEGPESQAENDAADGGESGLELARVKALEDIEELLLGRGGESELAQAALRHIVTRQTDEGLVIELFDRDGGVLFYPNSDEPTPVTELLGQVLANYLSVAENPLAIEAHVQAQPVVRRTNTVWQLSLERANRMRLLIEGGGYQPDDVARVTGHADKEPVVDDRTAARNSRLELILLRSGL